MQLKGRTPLSPYSFFPFSLTPFSLFAFIPLFLALLFSVVLVTTVAAQEPAANEPTADEVNRIAKQLYCPVCPSTPLDVCETKACEDWRALIRDKLAAGESEEAIIDYFVAQFGTRVLAAPPRRGPTLLVWLIPPLGLLAGGWLFWRLLRSRRSDLAPVTPALNGQESLSIPTEYLTRLEEDVRRG
jgi:cytochrome c-type biogenesis protein CcmH